MAKSSIESPRVTNLSGLEVVLALAKDAPPQARPWRVGAEEEIVGEIRRIHPRRVDRTLDHQPRLR